MPIYEYRCQDCGQTQELKLAITEDSSSPIVCTCGGTADRVYCAPNIRFVGPGFHNTDYRTNKKSDPKENPIPQETKAKADASKNNDTNQHA